MLNAKTPRTPRTRRTPRGRTPSKYWLVAVAITSIAMCFGARAADPMLAGKIDRPLRYKPDGGGFVIENGPDSFNRPLYGCGTAFRVDAGDRPQFSLYLP